MLVQVVMPDAEYREQANELAIALSEPHVKGVFEERLPLDLHAAIQLGCVTAVLPECRSKSMQDGFDLTDLQVCLHRLPLCPIPQELLQTLTWLRLQLASPAICKNFLFIVNFVTDGRPSGAAYINTTS